MLFEVTHKNFGILIRWIEHGFNIKLSNVKKPIPFPILIRKCSKIEKSLIEHGKEQVVLCEKTELVFIKLSTSVINKTFILRKAL